MQQDLVGQVGTGPTTVRTSQVVPLAGGEKQIDVAAAALGFPPARRRRVIALIDVLGVVIVILAGVPLASTIVRRPTEIVR